MQKGVRVRKGGTTKQLAQWFLVSRQAALLQYNSDERPDCCMRSGHKFPGVARCTWNNNRVRCVGIYGRRRNRYIVMLWKLMWRTCCCSAQIRRVQINLSVFVVVSARAPSVFICRFAIWERACDKNNGMRGGYIYMISSPRRCKSYLGIRTPANKLLVKLTGSAGVMEENIFCLLPVAACSGLPIKWMVQRHRKRSGLWELFLHAHRLSFEGNCISWSALAFSPHHKTGWAEYHVKLVGL